MLFAHELEQIGGSLLKIDAVEVVVLFFESEADALCGVVAGQLQCIGNFHAVYNCTHCGGGVDVAGAVEVLGLALGEVAFKLAAFALKAHNAQTVLLKAYAGDGGVLCAQLGKALEHLADVCLVISLLIFHVQHVAGFGDVGDDKVCTIAEGGHLLGEVGGEALVQHAVVGHGGVNDDLAVLAEGLEELADYVYLAVRGRGR